MDFNYSIIKMPLQGIFLKKITYYKVEYISFIYPILNQGFCSPGIIPFVALFNTFSTSKSLFYFEKIKKLVDINAT